MRLFYLFIKYDNKSLNYLQSENLITCHLKHKHKNSAIIYLSFDTFIIPRCILQSLIYIPKRNNFYFVLKI